MPESTSPGVKPFPPNPVNNGGDNHRKQSPDIKKVAGLTSSSHINRTKSLLVATEGEKPKRHPFSRPCRSGRIYISKIRYEVKKEKMKRNRKLYLILEY